VPVKNTNRGNGGRKVLVEGSEKRVCIKTIEKNNKEKDLVKRNPEKVRIGICDVAGLGDSRGKKDVYG